MTVYELKKLEGTKNDVAPCFCVGKQGDDPFCPCLMNRLKTIKSKHGDLARNVAEEIMHDTY